MDEAELEKYLHECLIVNEFALSEEYVRLPADIAFWATRAAEAYGAYQEAKMAREAASADLFGMHRLRLGPSGKPCTMDDAKEAVKRDERYVDARQREIDLDVERKRLDGIVEALRTKRDMLVSLGATQRAELERDPIIRTRSAAGLPR